MHKIMILGKENNIYHVDTDDGITVYALSSIKYGNEAWDAVIKLIGENNIDTIVGSKEDINIISRLLWECDNLYQYVLTDTEDAFQLERINDRRSMVRWDMVANKAEENDSIGQAGWISSFTGKAFSENEMKEFVQNVSHKLKKYVAISKKVFEIGIGSGLVCFAMASMVGEYIGMDISKIMLQKTRRALDSCGIGNVKLVQGGAMQISELGIHDADIIIINSVAQYFPGYNYFIEVLRRCIKCMTEKGIIFVGDILDLGKRNEYVNRLRESGGRASNEDLWYPKSFMEEVPAYVPQICEIEISEKEKGIIENELTYFRYDVIYKIDKSQDNHYKKTKYQWGKDWIWK